MDPQLKLSDNNSSSDGTVLQNHFIVVLQHTLKLQLHWWQRLVGRPVKERGTVEGRKRFNRFVPVYELPPCLDSEVSRSVGSFCGGVSIKIPKMVFGDAS